MRTAADQRLSILHVPHGFFPDACGGTEVDVLTLAGGLMARGVSVCVAAPGMAASSYEYQGIPVYRFAVGKGGMGAAYAMADEFAAVGFEAIVERLRPDVVHLHARTAAVSEVLVGIAKRAGAKVVFTYHTPAASCVRGTMLHFGRESCDGALNGPRCSACKLALHGAPAFLARAVASLMRPIARPVARIDLPYPYSALRLPGLIERSHEGFRELVTSADRVVAACEWARGVLIRNGVDEKKIVLSRHGVERSRGSTQVRTRRAGKQPLRVAYFGRLAPEKGVDVLIEAMKLVPRAHLRLDLFVIHQGHERGRRRLMRVAAEDPRIQVRDAVPPDEVREIMSSYEAVVVPSVGLETGPLVVLEAFSAGVPVIGSNLGGIAELVRDGVDGVLVPWGNARAWSDALARLSVDRSALERLQSNVRPGRTSEDVVEDMIRLYAELVPSKFAVEGRKPGAGEALAQAGRGGRAAHA